MKPLKLSGNMRVIPLREEDREPLVGSEEKIAALVAALEACKDAICLQSVRDGADQHMRKGWHNLESIARAALNLAKGE